MSEEKVVGSPETEAVVEEVDPRAPKLEPEVPEKPVEELEEPKSDDVVEEVVEVVPDQYRDKTPEELIEMHRNLEKVMGKQGQKLGEYKSVLSPYANFDDDGNVVSWKENTPAVKQPENRTQEDWDKIEEETGVTKKAFEVIERKIEKSFEERLQATLQPINQRFHQTDLDIGLRGLEEDAVKYPSAKEWDNEIRAELEKEDIKYRHLPWMIEEKYLIVAGRKSVEARSKTKTVSPKEEVKQPYAETPTSARSEQQQEYDPLANMRADKEERERLKGF